MTTQTENAFGGEGTQQTQCIRTRRSPVKENTLSGTSRYGAQRTSGYHFQNRHGVMVSRGELSMFLIQD